MHLRYYPDWMSEYGYRPHYRAGLQARFQGVTQTVLVPKQAYRDFLNEPLRGDFFSAAGRRQPKMA